MSSMNGGGRSRRPGPVPERWLKCPRKAVDLLQGKFLVFKTPLDEKFDDQVPEQYRFPVDFVFSSMKSYKVKVGLWIDLTNTSRFYDKKVVENGGCQYVKLQCKGRGEAPTEEQTSAFVKVCDTFIRQKPLEAIGIHCTHGFNRSGFLLISFLVRIWDWDLGAAINEFARVRPPGIYKKEYIDELYSRFDDVAYAKEAPPLPGWCLEFEGEDSDGEQPEEKRKGDWSDEPDKKRRRRSEMVKANPTFMEGVPGVTVVEAPLLGTIQRKVQDLCKWQSSGFPGSQPVSMTKENIQLLAQKPYRVSWKADGVRYLMYIQDKDEIFCIDRDNSVFRVHGMSFFYRKNLDNRMKDTLLDGEMVMDRVNGVNMPRYLVYDIISLYKYPIMDSEFYPKRYEAICVDVIEPRNVAERRGLINKQHEPFSVRLKEFLDVRDASKFLSEKFFRSLLHEPDGLIFQPAKDPYKVGRCDDVLKWKPASLNSVDFRLKIVRETGMGLVGKKIGELYVGGLESKFAVISSLKNIQHLDNKIVECTYQDGKWKFLRERTDKSFPNSFTTAEAVCHSIRHPVTKELLLDFIEEHVTFHMDSMPPPTYFPPRRNH